MVLTMGESPTPNHTPEGRFAPGNNANPNGRPRHRMTWQSYADRVDFFLNTYTRGQIKAIVTDPVAYDKFVVRDAFILQSIAEALQADGLASRREIINRVIGEAVKRNEVSGVGGGAIKTSSNVTLNITTA